MESETFKRIQINEEVFVMVARYDSNEGFKELEPEFKTALPN